jgi:hypothetical protein
MEGNVHGVSPVYDLNICQEKPMKTTTNVNKIIG